MSTDDAGEGVSMRGAQATGADRGRAAADALPRAERQALRGHCTCSGERNIEGGRVVTVGCPVHHVMADGTPAGEVEVRCMCGNFVDGRECVPYIDRDDDPEDIDAQAQVCPRCRDWAEEQDHLVPVGQENPSDG